MKNRVVIFWFRRDLRLQDNVGLFNAHLESIPVLPLFIFDTEILKKFSKEDRKISMIYDFVQDLAKDIKRVGGNLQIFMGEPLDIFQQLKKEYRIAKVYTNKDYEPYAIRRDNQIKKFCEDENIVFQSYKDQVIFEENEILKKDGKPYTVFTPYKRKWLNALQEEQHIKNYEIEQYNFVKNDVSEFSFEKLGFYRKAYSLKEIQMDLPNYEIERDYPSLDATSNLSVYLRFGLLSIRKVISELLTNPTLMSELIWREFFMQILFHFPNVETSNFRSKYDHLKWINNEIEFEKWKNGETGYPIVDAGMIELNQTGFMHNRVRMITASFLTKHLLIDWRWGEAYFAEKLLDYELASNNGNWQWAASTGCDAVPYFRIFNPITQQTKFDKDFLYIKKWNPKYLNKKQMIDHKFARERAIETYKL
jgi:deoxyribodipyrimidine photo-lyase